MVLLSRRSARKARNSGSTTSKNDAGVKHAVNGSSSRRSNNDLDGQRESPLATEAQSMLTTTILFEQSMLPSNAGKVEVSESETKSPTPRCSWIAAGTVLDHSYQLCGCRSDEEPPRHAWQNSRSSIRGRDDPTMKESIEIIVTSPQSQTNLCDKATASMLGIPPSRILQSRTQSRSLRCSESQKTNLSSLVVGHVETVEKAKEIIDDPERIPSADESAVKADHLLRCPCVTHSVPSHPRSWPQRPLLLLPSRGTTVLGVRFCNSKTYLWKPGDSGTWFTALWKEPTALEGTSCGRCCSLPINNGNESEALVTDFATPLFRGTLLVRIRDSKGTTNNKEDIYFRGMNRRYQAVVQGRFLEPIDLIRCQTGFKLDRPCGKLPPKWIVKSALRVMHFFAPQLQAVVDSTAASYALTPLGSTPQCIILDDEQVDIEGVLQEPEAYQHTLLGTTCGQSSMQRARYRKKIWDRRYQDGNPMPANTSTTYVFEFLQHLFDFHQLHLDLGSLGSIGLQGILNGQPLNILALHGSSPLWSFDLWHEQLYEDALEYNRGSR